MRRSATTTQRPSHTAVGAFVVALCVAWATFIIYVADANLPYNALTLPLQSKFDLRAVLPEGWAFFTKDPRTERITTLRAIDDHWQSAQLSPQSSWRSFFGIDRSARAQGVETGLLMHGVPTAQWRNCKSLPTSCLAAEALQPFPTTNRSPRPTLCGDIAIVLQTPTPWAWSRSGRIVNMPSRYLKLRVRC